MEANFQQNPMKRAMRSCRRQCESEPVSRKKKEVDSLACIPDDLLVEILKDLPPDLLRYKVKFVCRRWFVLITSRILLDDASLILEKSPASHTVRLMDIREEKEGLKMKQLLIHLPYKGRIRSWCNEYLLINYPNEVGSLHIFNLITKQGSFLPPCSISCGGHRRCKCGVGLSYDEFKGVYKIFHVIMGPPIQCELLVVKSNIACYDWSDWKKVNGPIYPGQRQYFWDDPVSVRGRYFHWDVHCSNYLLSMDTVKERFRLTCLPGSDDYRMNKQYTLFEMGGFLTLLHKMPFDQVNVWMLKNFQRTKWEKFHSICILSYVCFGIDYPGNAACYPVTSVRSKGYIVFRKLGSGNGLYSYDLKNEIMKKLDFDIAGDERCVVHSTTSSFLYDGYR